MIDNEFSNLPKSEENQEITLTKEEKIIVIVVTLVICGFTLLLLLIRY